MDVVLINPINIKSHPFGISPPLGLCLIGCELEKRGFSVKILDLEVLPLDFDLYACLRDLVPKVVGISGTTHSRFESFRIANIAKKVSAEIVTVYGGCHATFASVDTLTHIQDIDYIVRGEGEVTFIELVHCLVSGKGKAEDIKGINFRKDGGIIENPPRERIEDLDSLCYSRHLIEMDKYPIILDWLNIPAVIIMTARGCPFNCSFCSASAMFGKKYTRRSTKKIVEEIRYGMEKFNIKGIRFFDSTFTLNREHVLSLTEELKKISPLLPWHCEIRVDTADEFLLASMKESGCYSVDFGVESGSERIIATMGKRITSQQVENVVHWCRKLGIRTVAFFSFGHIGETWLDAQRTIALIGRLYPYIDVTSVIFGMRIYPGTFMERYALENKLLPGDFSWSSPFQNIEAGVVVTDNVPLLLQPQFGIKELQRCNLAYEKIQTKNLLSLKSIVNKSKQIRSFPVFLHKSYTMLKSLKKIVLR